jgi:hypothetical protein
VHFRLRGTSLAMLGSIVGLVANLFIRRTSWSGGAPRELEVLQCQYNVLLFCRPIKGGNPPMIEMSTIEGLDHIMLASKVDHLLLIDFG